MDFERGRWSPDASATTTEAEASTAGRGAQIVETEKVPTMEVDQESMLRKEIGSEDRRLTAAMWNTWSVFKPRKCSGTVLVP